VPLLEAPGLRPDLHEGHVGAVVDEQRGFGNLAHGAREPGPVLVPHGALAHVLQQHPGLRREQAHGDLGPAHFQREDDRGLLVLDRRRAADVQAQRGVVRGNHGARGEVQVRGVVDLDAPDGNARHRAHIGDEARVPARRRPRGSLLVDQPLALQRKDVVRRGEGDGERRRRVLAPTSHRAGREPRPVAQAVDELKDVTRQAFVRHGELDSTGGTHGPVGVQQPGKQCPALGFTSALVLSRDVLAAQDAQRSQARLDGSVSFMALRTPAPARTGLAAHPARRRLRGRRHGPSPTTAGASTCLHFRRTGNEQGAADDALSLDDLILNRADGERATSTRDHAVPEPFDPHGDLRVGGRVAGARAVPVAQPDAEHVRLDREVSFWQRERLGVRHAVVQPRVSHLAPQRCSDLPCGPDLCKRPLVPVTVVPGCGGLRRLP